MGVRRWGSDHFGYCLPVEQCTDDRWPGRQVENAETSAPASAGRSVLAVPTAFGSPLRMHDQRAPKVIELIYLRDAERSFDVDAPGCERVPVCSRLQAGRRETKRCREVAADDDDFEEETELEAEMPEGEGDFEGEFDGDLEEADLEDGEFDLDDIADDELEGDPLGDDDADDADDALVVDDLEVPEPEPVRPKAEDEEEEEEDTLDPDDVEASLDDILKDRLVIEEVEVDDDEEHPDVDDRGSETSVVIPKRPDEFVCQSCFLVKHPSQMADKNRLLCRDCV